MIEENMPEKNETDQAADDMRALLRTDPEKWREIRMEEIRRLLDGNKDAVQSAVADVPAIVPKPLAKIQGSNLS